VSLIYIVRVDFHVVANQRWRKTTIHTIEGTDGAVESTEGITEVATQYYKDLFKFEPRPNIKLSGEFFSNEEKVSDEEREVLERRFSEEEVNKAVFESYSDRPLVLMEYHSCSINNFGRLLG
jgi:hypothetical protein